MNSSFFKPQPKVVLADRSRLVTEGIRLVLDNSGLRVMGEAHSVEEAAALMREVQPDVLVMEADLLKEAEALLGSPPPKPGCKVLILGINDDPQWVASLLRSRSINGYLSKDITSDQLVRAIFTLMHGQVLIEGSLVEQVLLANEAASQPRPSSGRMAACESLTARELDVLRLLASGASNMEIAQDLKISLSTVKSHVHNLLKKLNVSSRLEAVEYYESFSRQLILG